jgi:hypothetical protein
MAGKFDGKSTDTAVKQVKAGLYGEDLAEEKRSAATRENTEKLKGYGPPCTGEVGSAEVQGPLEAIGGGSASAPNFPLYSSKK